MGLPSTGIVPKAPSRLPPSVETYFPAAGRPFPPPATRRPVLPIRRGLFADAEPAEDAVEDVVGDDGADDLAELVDGLPQVDRDELVAAVEEQGLRRRPEGLAGPGEALAAARPGGGGEVAVG